MGTRFIPLLAFSVMVQACNPIPKGSGPSARDIYVVSTDDALLPDLVKVAQAVEPRLGPPVDKTKEMLDFGDSKSPRFPYYQEALWFPRDGSDHYGLAIIKWQPGAPETDNRYFVAIYAEDEACNLCEVVTKNLAAERIAYYSACTSPKATKADSLGCGT